MITTIESLLQQLVQIRPATITQLVYQTIMYAKAPSGAKNKSELEATIEKISFV